jgi:RNA polymerase sigma factor (sigma-70 family)
MEHLRGSACPAAAEPTDRELIQRFVTRREEGAFTELVHRHGPMVLGVCRRVLDNAEDVEDAFQATFMILVRKADSIRNRDSAASWLYGVALRVARRARVSIRHRKERERRMAVPVTAAAPEEAWRDLRPVLDDAVEALPEKYRVLVVLCYLQGYTYDQAARLLDLAKGTVSTRLTQARTLLRQRLTRRGVVVPLALLATLLEHNAAPAAVPPHLPPLALQGGKVAAGLAGAVSDRVAMLALTKIASGSLLAPVMVAVLAGLIATLTGGLLIYRNFGPARNTVARGDDESQKWTQRFSRADQSFLAYSIRISPDEKMFAWQAGDMSLRVADLDTGKELAKFQLPNNQPNSSSGICLGFTPDNRCVISAWSEVRLWDIATQNEVARFSGSAAAKWGPDGKTIATVASDGAIHLINLADRTERVIPERLPGPVKALCFHPDGTSLATGGRDGAVVFYNTATLQKVRRLPGNATPTLELAFSPDGLYLATLHGNPDLQAGAAARVTQIWNLETEQNTVLPPQHVTELAFLPHGRTLVTQEVDGMLDTWDPATGERGQHFYPGGKGNRLPRLVFSPDGKIIVTGNARGSAFLRSLTSTKTLASLPHSGMLFDAAFTADGRRLVTGTSNFTQDGQTNNNAEVMIWGRDH